MRHTRRTYKKRERGSEGEKPNELYGKLNRLKAKRARYKSTTLSEKPKELKTKQDKV